MKYLLSIFILFSSFLFCGHDGHRHVFKKYVAMKEIRFKDGHFRLTSHPKLKLKSLRANNAGIYYTPKDICTKKKIHRHHEKSFNSLEEMYAKPEGQH